MTEAFVIHLARAAARRPQVDRLLAMLPMPATVIDAVDGSRLSESELNTVVTQRLHRPYYPFQLRPQEVGCFLSHRRAWAAIVDRDLEAGLIVEDDVDFELEDLRPLLDFVLGAMGPGDYVRFPYRHRYLSGRVKAKHGSFSLIQPYVVGLGTQMQVVGRDAAERLLAATARFDRPVDTTMQMFWLTRVRMLTAQPLVIREIAGTLGGTLVQKKHAQPLSRTLSREVSRAFYRLRVRLASARARTPG